jgi:hypothetical protein
VDAGALVEVVLPAARLLAISTNKVAALDAGTETTFEVSTECCFCFNGC